MDSTAAGIVLLGSDGSSVQWASLAIGGGLGAVHRADVPEHRDGPWFALAGTIAAADHLVIAFTTPPADPIGALPGTAAAPNRVDADLWTFAVAIDGTSASTPTRIATVPDTRTLPVELGMSSGRAGMHAGLTWAVRGAGAKVSTLVLDGTGTAIGPVLDLPAAVDDFDCLGFAPGRGDLTVGYVDLSGTPPLPAFVFTEIGSEGLPQGTFRLPLGKLMPGCVELAPTDTGYGVAWHNVEGTFTGVFAPSAASTSFKFDLAVGDVRLSDGPPTLRGLAFSGRDLILAVARPAALEAWRIDLNSRREGGPLVFPSSMGQLGALSTAPVGGSLFGTYADYSSKPPGGAATGRRFIGKVTCP